MTFRHPIARLAVLLAAAALTACAAPAPVKAQQPIATTQVAPLPENVDHALASVLTANAPDRDTALLQLATAIEANSRDASVLQTLIAHIESEVAAQFRTMLTSDDPETRARIARLLDFNAGLANFAAEAVALPQPQRGEILAWGLSPAGAELAARAYSNDSVARAAAARELGPRADAASAWLLGRLIEDGDREVALNAMDTAWDRKPSVALVEALWNKAVAFPLRQSTFGAAFATPASSRIQIPGPGKTLAIHGRMVALYPNQSAAAGWLSDGEVATDILVLWKDPLIERHLSELFTQAASARAGGNPANLFALISPNYSGAAAPNIARLMLAYQPKTLVPYLVRASLMPMSDGYVSTIGVDTYRWSSRIDALALLLAVTDQDRGDYGLVHLAQYGNRWMLKGSEADEVENIKKVRAWWQKHFSEYGAASPEFADEGETPEPPSFRGRGMMFGERG